uniref:Uncharacterized protein n=1 Tax=Cannabis sativa TaxID=3483 RepID=A0A803PG19_CANSA
MKRITKALFTLTLLVSFMVRIEGGRDLPTKGESSPDINSPQRTLGLFGPGWVLGGLFPWIGLGLGALIPILEVPWLLRHSGYGGQHPRKNHDVIDGTKEYYPPKGDTLVSQSP